MTEISGKILVEFDPVIHGYHRKCFQLFTLLPMSTKRQATSSSCADDEVPSTSKKSKRSSTPSSALSSALFPQHKCLFCDRRTFYINRKKQSLVTCVTLIAQQSFKPAALEKGDDDILRKVSDQDLGAQEARYHESCRKYYTRRSTRHTTHKDSAASQSQAAHMLHFSLSFLILKKTY